MKRNLLLLLSLALIQLTAFGNDKLSVSLDPIASGFTSPLNLLTLADGTGRLLISDQSGVIYLLDKGSVRETPVLDLRPKMVELRTAFDERGLLGMALHPKFKENKKVYLFYSAPLRKEGPEGWNHTSHLSEFKMEKGETISLQSEKIILQIDEPAFNHNGGRMEFGPDGFLYIAVGDGGDGNDVGLGHSEQGNGQDTSKLLGKILRIDVDRGNPYSIPQDNPFAKEGGKPEIYAYGIRNPWGLSFDRAGKRELFVADVGQNMFEEINIIEKGGNYGWRIKEGFGYFDPKNPNKSGTEGPTTGADGKPLIDPIIAYKNFKGFPSLREAQGISVTGGYVYRGKAIPSLLGKYIFADWSKTWAKGQGVLFAATRPDQPGGKWTHETLEVVGGKVDAYIVALGQDEEGEIYILTNASNQVVGKTGKVMKLMPPKASAN